MKPGSPLLASRTVLRRLVALSMAVLLLPLGQVELFAQQPYPYPDAQDQVKRLLERFSAQRLMWATNWPVSLAQLPYAKIVELYRDHMSFLTPDEREAILSGTVERVWPFGL